MTILQRLPHMTRSELINYWLGYKFPFDAAKCGKCITGHAVGLCNWQEHAQYRNAARKMLFSIDGSPVQGLDEVIALRTFFNHLYEYTPDPDEGDDATQARTLAVQLQAQAR